MMLPVPFADIQAAVVAYHEHIDQGFKPRGGRSANAMTALFHAAQSLGLRTSKALASRLDTASGLGLEVRGWQAIDPQWAADVLLRYRTYDPEFQDAESRLTRPGTTRPAPTRISKKQATTSPPVADGQPAGREPELTEIVAQVVPLLRRGPLSVGELAEKLKCQPALAEAAALVAHQQGASIAVRGGKWHFEATPVMGTQAQRGQFELVTDKDGYIEFGASGDQHLCSKYERLDCLNDYYDEVEKRGLKVVLSAGNHIDGESSFNRHDIVCHGMDEQMQYLARNFPKRDGVDTWAITGEDHEGWWARREGVDVGRYTENVMRQNGRTDWHDLGFMECFIPLVNGDTGKSSQLCLMHPGGGSAYAISYAPQKIVEGFDGGAKPAVLLIGHYHKASYQMTRNVHTLQTGTFCDQTLFMRQKKLAAHVGGWFIKLHVDPASGAVDEFTCTFRNYFVKEFYAGRWSEHGRAVPVVRSPKP